MPSFELTGKLFKKYETESKTQSFQAREFVVEMNDNNYMNYIKFQLTQDRCQLLDPYNEGEDIKVHFDLRGREWNGKYFTNLNAWKLEKTDQGAGGPPPMANDGFDQTAGNSSMPSADQEPTFDDDLPF